MKNRGRSWNEWTVPLCFWLRSSIFRIPWSQSFRFRNELAKRYFAHVQITIQIRHYDRWCAFSFFFIIIIIFFLSINESRTLSFNKYGVQRKERQKKSVKMSRKVLQRMLLLIFSKSCLNPKNEKLLLLLFNYARFTY